VPGIGARFAGYELIERLSAGGMGELFLARHGLEGFEKQLVIKKVLPHLADDGDFIARFVDEARIAVRLSHANIAQVFEVGRVGDEHFLALEHVAGKDLRATLTALTKAGGRMPPPVALYVARELCRGVSYLHRQRTADGGPLGLVHCDLSPPNVMLSYEGEVKLIDFGVARSVLRRARTDPEQGFGKFGYMSPEQLQRGVAIDHRTDVYAIGAVLFEMLTGRRLFEPSVGVDYRAVARQVVRGEHPLPSEVHRSLARFDPLLARALAPSVEARFQTAADLRDAIQAQLVALAPTFDGEHLGAFVRAQFPAAAPVAPAGPRRRLARGSEGALALALPPPPPRVADGTAATLTEGLTRELPSPAARRRRGWFAAGVALLVAVAAVVAWLAPLG
jgi:serine/threonine protein kinase